MSLEVEEQCIREWLEYEESTNEVARPSKITYTRAFLLSFTDLDICKEPPSGSEQSILSESEDAFSSTCEWQRVQHGSLPLYGISSTEYGLEPSSRCNSDNYSQESSGKWDNSSPRLNDRDSHLHSHCDSDFGRRYENLTQCSWQNPESDGILRRGGFSIVSGSTAGVSAERNQENCGIKLNKSGNPYRPPHSYKDNHTSRRISVVGNIVSDTSEKKQLEEHIVSSCQQQHETKSLDACFIDGSTKSVSTSSAEKVSHNIGPVANRAPITLKGCFTQENEDTSEADDGQGSLLHASKFAPLFLEEKQPTCASLSRSTKGRAHMYKGCNGLIAAFSSPPFSSDTSELAHKLTTTSLASTTYESFEKLNDCFKPTMNSGVFMPPSPQKTGLLDANGNSSAQFHTFQGHSFSEIENKQPHFANSDGVYRCFSPFSHKMSPQHLSTFSLGSLDKLHYSEKRSCSNVSNIYMNEKTWTFEKNLTLEATFGRDYMREFQSDEAALLVQRCYVDGISRSDISEPQGSQISVVDDNIVTLVVDECGAIGTYHHGLDTKNYAGKIELDKTEKNQSDFDETLAEIWSILQMDQEVKLDICDETVDSEVEFCLPYEDGLITVDYPTIPEGSEFEPGSALVTENKSKVSPVAGCDEIDDLQDEICLPDEDTLITIEDLLAPYKLMNPLKANMFTSNIITDDKLADLNTVDGNERCPVPHSETPIIDTMCFGSYPNQKLQQYDSRSDQAQKLGRPSFHSSDPHKAHMNTRAKFMDYPRVTRHTHPVQPSCTNASLPSQKTPPAKLKGFEHPIGYSFLQQPVPFPQQNLPLRVAAFSDPINQMVCYRQDFIPAKYQQTSYLVFGMPNLDCGVAGVDIQTESEANQVHPLAINGNGQNYRKQYGTGFWYARSMT